MNAAEHVERWIEISPALGRLRLVATDEALVGVYFAEHCRPREVAARVLEKGTAHDVLDRATRELEEYARGTRSDFTVPLAADGTELQRAVWKALRAIPHGETRSYSDLASAIGKPRAVRAVGAANALNPLSIVVPCHRVIGADGSMTGYGGGIERKVFLLALEARKRGAVMRDQLALV